MRILALFVATGMCLLLSGCSKENASQGTAAATSATRIVSGANPEESLDEYFRFRPPADDAGYNLAREQQLIEEQARWAKQQLDDVARQTSQALEQTRGELTQEVQGHADWLSGRLEDAKNMVDQAPRQLDRYIDSQIPPRAAQRESAGKEQRDLEFEDLFVR